MGKSFFTLSLLLGSLATTAYAADFESDGIYYNITSQEDKTVEVAANDESDYAGTIVIPETVTYSDVTYAVTAIGSEAFSRSGINGIELPASITSIGASAFYYCTSLTDIKLPASVTEIGSYAFCFCTSLPEITVPESVTTISDGTFYGCSSFTTITIPASVTAIGSNAFAYCSNIATVTSLNPVPPTIGENAFKDCSVLAVYVPADAVATYGAAEGWKDFYVADLSTKPEEEIVTAFTVDDFTYRRTSLLDNVVKLEIGSNSDVVVIPETVDYDGTTYTVTAIGSEAFYWRSSLTGVTIPATVTTIGDMAFYYCKSLTTVTSLNPVPPTLGGDVFFKCDVQMVYVPADAIDAYEAADGWKDMLIADVENPVDPNFTVDGINYHIISLKSHNVEVTEGDYNDAVVIPGTIEYDGTTYTVTKIGDEAFEYQWMSSITLPETITTIGRSAFYFCSSLTELTLPASVTTISDFAFYNCIELAFVTDLNPEPPTLGAYAFYGCNILAAYVPTDAVDAYKAAEGWEDLPIFDIATKPATLASAFTVDGISYKVTSMQDFSVKVVQDDDYSGDVVIPATVTYADVTYAVTEIKSYAFSLNSTVSSVTIPASVTTIGDYAFYGTSLVTITSLNPVPPTLGECALDDNNILAIYVPTEAIEAYKAADGWKEYYITDLDNQFITSFTVDGINYTVTSLQENIVRVAVGDYSGDIVIPETVTYADTEYTVAEIGASAFSESDITSIEIPATVTSIGDYAFYKCTSLAYVTSLNPEPPTIASSFFFDSMVFYGCDITAVYVPADAVDAYKAASVWKDLFITAIGSSGIGEVSAAGNDAAECYTLQGVRVNTVRTMNDLESLARGIYIVNGRKTLVK
jgi:hypothetical protein